MKGKFYQYFFSNLCNFIAWLFIIALLLIASLYASSIGNPFTIEQVILFLALSLLPFLLYICLAPRLVFQKVVITSEGIEICFFKKCIKKCTWNSILKIEDSNHMKNPALKITLQNEDVFYLDKRKAIVQAIRFYSDKHMVI